MLPKFNVLWGVYHRPELREFVDELLDEEMALDYWAAVVLEL